MRFLAPLLAVLCTACLSTGDRPDWPAIGAQLAQRVAVDQEVRRQLQDGFDDPELFRRASAVDQDNTAWMKELVAHHGWPTISQVGKEGAGNAWLLVQHADQDVVFQEHCLELLARAVEAGEASPKNLAYLEDRVALHRGRPQRYGTQFVQAPGGNGFVPHTLADPERVDELRASVGLAPLAEYAELINGHR